MRPRLASSFFFVAALPLGLLIATVPSGSCVLAIPVVAGVVLIAPFCRSLGRSLGHRLLKVGAWLFLVSCCTSRAGA
ncbi:MAG: hypothetical protein AB1486_12805 [Planctomycetota bacterium]